MPDSPDPPEGPETEGLHPPSKKDPRSEALLRLGVIRRSHGIRGGLRVEYFGEDPLDLLDLKEVFLESPDGKGRARVRVTKVTVSPPGILVALGKVSTRTDADRLKGFFLSAPRKDFPEPEDDEFYQADLLGLPVLTRDGTLVGEVESFPEFGGTPLMSVRKTAGGSLIVPWTEEFIMEADTGSGRVVIDDVPGLLDQD
jgi:16S rRNA processing protein RimM